MNNYKQSGHTLTLIALAAVASGAGMLFGNLFGVAVADVESGEEGAFLVEGVIELPALATDTFTQGQTVYWDNTNKRVTETTTGNYPIGVAIEAKAGTIASSKVRLNGTSTAAAA